MKKALALVTRFILVGVLTAACQDDGMVIAEQIPPASMANGPTGSSVAQTELEKAAVRGLLLGSCGSCHGDSQERPPHSLSASRDGADPIPDIGDIDALVASGLIEPGLPEESPLLFAMASGQMPPIGSGLPPVSGEDLRRVEKFIVRMDPPTQAEVIDILLRNCGLCHDQHQAVQPVIAIDDIADVGLLVTAGLIVPGDRDQSQLYTVVLDGDMPPRGAGVPPVSNRDLARLGGYIDLLSGAAPAPRNGGLQPKAP
jgi:hypothetical protein